MIFKADSWIPNLTKLLSNKYKSTENFNVESNTQYTTKQNRYSIQSTNTVTRNGISENFNFGAEFNKNTNIGMYFKILLDYYYMVLYLI